jgi:streptomycin 6-kinase
VRYDSGAQLLEYADGDELVTLVERGEDENATRILGQVIKQLHNVPQDDPPAGLLRLEHWFGALLQKGATDRKAGSKSIYARSSSLAEKLLAEQREIRVLHGDIHHYNIKHSPRGWLAFDPKGVVGERTYDCANALCNPVMPELVHNETRLLNNAVILADTLNLNLGRVLAFTYIYSCLNASWWLLRNGMAEAEDIVRWHLDVASIIEPHIKML